MNSRNLHVCVFLASLLILSAVVSGEEDYSDTVQKTADLSSDAAARLSNFQTYLPDDLEKGDALYSLQNQLKDDLSRINILQGSIESYYSSGDYNKLTRAADEIHETAQRIFAYECMFNVKQLLTDIHLLSTNYKVRTRFEEVQRADELYEQRSKYVNGKTYLNIATNVRTI